MCKLSVCISKNLRWLNKQVKRVLRSDTRRWGHSRHWGHGCDFLGHLF